MTIEDSDSDDTLLDMSRKKKSKKRVQRNLLAEIPATSESPQNAADNDTTSADGDFTYSYLISRAYETLNMEKKPTDETRFGLPPIQLARLGTRRTSFVNFNSSCKALKREQKHVHDYFIAELGTTASIDDSKALIIRGRFRQQHIENVLLSYRKEYVMCKTCRSGNTFLDREDRLTMLHCRACHSHYSVANIRTGFQAQIGKRSKQN